MRIYAKCSWLDGSDNFSHFVFEERQTDITGAYAGSRIFIPKNWAGNIYIHDDSLQLHLNGQTAGLDGIVDIGEILSPQSYSFTDKNKKFLALTEPSHIIGDQVEKRMDDIKFYYGHVLGWQPVLKNHPGFSYWNPTQAWVKPLESTNKPFGLTGIFSGKKLNGHGYDIRHQIIDLQDKINIPSEIFNYTKKWKGKDINYPVKDKTQIMWCMYSFAIENGSEDGYFSEKIVDCFLTKTIPIYYGAPDIGKYFNEKGIIKINDDNWIDVVNSLTPEYYKQNLEAINENFERAKEYSCMICSLARKIKELIK